MSATTGCEEMTALQPRTESTHTLDLLLSNTTALRDITSPAGRILARAFDIQPSSLAAALTYSIAERRLIVDQLQLMLSGFYVHLERKKAIYGFDPVRALQLLEGAIETMTDGEFHQSITELVARTRDRHLVFTGKSPFGLLASLGFMIERCFVDGKEVYVVTRIDADLSPKQLKTGAKVSHWNNVPIERFVRLNANILDGGNEAASLARSLAFLTQRPLGRFGPPMEEWVDLRFELQGGFMEERFAWRGIDTTQTPVFPAIGKNLIGFGGDLDLMHLQHARRLQFASQSFDPLLAEAAEPGVPNIIGKILDGLLEYGTVSSDAGSFAYIRLRDFQVSDVEAIIDGFVPVIPLLPRNGLIIDMRGNTGGYIAAGERLLQIFTPKRITPSRFQFRVTPATRAMVNATDRFMAWRRSFDESFATGEPFTRGFPIEGTDEDANKVGQRYFGPTVIVTDALAFSTADMFVAGFVDHDIGHVICIDRNIAAAGGNNWYWKVLRLLTPDFRIDLALRDALERRVLSPEIRHAFNEHRVSLSDEATVAGREDEDGDITWRIADGALRHAVRYLSWLDDSALLVYLDQGRLGLSDLPASVNIGFTVRRCMRIGKNEGRLLEDLGIEPDVVHHMTFKDITEKNQDLMTRACRELAAMPADDLELSTAPAKGGYRLSCRTRNIRLLQVRAGERYLAASEAYDDKRTEFDIPSGFNELAVDGIQGDHVVARSRVFLAATAT
jgi:hypothetical protein